MYIGTLARDCSSQERGLPATVPTVQSLHGTAAGRGRAVTGRPVKRCLPWLVINLSWLSNAVAAAVIVFCVSAGPGCSGAQESMCGFVYTLRTPNGTSRHGSCAGRLSTESLQIRRGQTFEIRSTKESSGAPLLQAPVSDDPTVVAQVVVRARGGAATYRAVAVGEATLGTPPRLCPDGLVPSRASPRPGVTTAPMCAVLHVQVGP